MKLTKMGCQNIDPALLIGPLVIAVLDLPLNK